MNETPETPQARLWKLATEAATLEKAAALLERAGSQHQLLAATECRHLATLRRDAAQVVREEIATATRARMAARRASGVLT